MKTSLFSSTPTHTCKGQIKWRYLLCLSSTLFMFYGLFSNNMLIASSSMNRNAYTASIERVWEEHSVIRNGQKGIVIHVAFNANNSRGKECSVVAYFHYGNGQALRDQNGVYVSSLGTVSSLERFTPPYDETRYSDYDLFIPYAELHVEGTLQIMYYVMVRTGDGKSAKSGNFYFNLTWGQNADEENGSLSCTVNCPKDGEPCSKFTIRLVGEDVSETVQVSSAGRVTFNDLPTGNYQVSIYFNGDSKKGDDSTTRVPGFNRPSQRINIYAGQRSNIHFE